MFDHISSSSQKLFSAGIRCELKNNADFNLLPLCLWKAVKQFSTFNERQICVEFFLQCHLMFESVQPV